MAKKVIEPSYQTLADLAELFGSCVYQAPAMQQSEKLDEAVLPTDNKIFTGRTTRPGVVSPDPLVELDNGQVVKPRNVTGQAFDGDSEVLVMQNTSGEYILFAGGGVYGNNTYSPHERRASYFEFWVMPDGTTPSDRPVTSDNTFDVVDTQKLLDMIDELRAAVNTLIERIDLHTHTVSQGVTSTPVTPMDPTSTIRNNTLKRQQDLVKTRSDMFSIKYPKNN